MKRVYFLFFSLVIVLLIFSCKKDITPAYLLLSEEDFTDCIDVTNFNKDHEENYDEDELNTIKQQNFTDILVSLNGKELGYWKLPCKIPLLPDYSKENNIRVMPCVRTFNTSFTTTPYYFISPVERFFDIEKKDSIKFKNLKFEYVKSVSFPVLETFSQTTTFQPLDTIFPTPIKIFPYNKEGFKNVGRIALEDTVDFFRVGTSYFTLQGRGVRHFWEMYYKCENGEMVTFLNFEKAVTGVTYQSLIVFPATTTWKKAYIDITEWVSLACGSASLISVRLGIQGYPTSDKQNAYFYFQNIKLITMSAPY